MFSDIRSKKVIFVAHCMLNQNAISDGTAVWPAAHKALIDKCLAADAGIVQLPCPELMCLGLDRGDPEGAERPVTVENTRIRHAMSDDPESPAAGRLQMLADQTVYQIREYLKHDFKVLGISLGQVPSVKHPDVLWLVPILSFLSQMASSSGAIGFAYTSWKR